MEINHETCGRCGRKLKTEKSRIEGFGPVCKKKFETEKTIVDGPDQTTVFDDLRNAINNHFDGVGSDE